MVTSLPKGTYIRYRYQYKWDYGLMVDTPHGLAMRLVDQATIEPGTRIHQGIWKRGSVFVVRKIIRLRKAR